MKNFVQPGDVLTVPAPAALSSGDVVIVGALVGIAAKDAANGADVSVSTRGVYTLPKEAALAVGLGDVIYWDASASAATTEATDNTEIGIATETVAGSAGELSVLIG